MSGVVKQLDLTPPPIVKTIAQRSLIVGVVFGIAAVALAFIRPDAFYRAYLLGFLCWLGVALGPLAIILICPRTGGAWGVWCSVHEPKAAFYSATQKWGREPLRHIRQRHYGLGLNRIRSIVEAHGGELQAQYDPKAATLVSTMALPMSSGQSEHA